MLFKLAKFGAFWRFRTRFDVKVCRGDVYTRNGVCSLLCSSFSSMTMSKDVDEASNLVESPELPSWVKFSEKGVLSSSPDDDFVLPSISHWVDENKVLDLKVGLESQGGDVDGSDVDKISRILKNPFDSPDDVVQALNDCGVAVSNDLVDQLLKRFSKNWIMAFGYFKWAQMQEGFKHFPHSYNMMIDILGKSKKFDLMWEMVEEMDQLGGHVTFDTLTKVMRRLAKACKYSDVIEAFRNMDQFQLKRDVVTLNVLIDILAKEGTVELAQDMYNEFRNQITPDRVTYNVLIRGWCKVGNMDKARQIMEEMQKSGVCPDVISYTPFINAYCHERNFRKVDEILEEMQEKNCPPNVVTYTIVMHARGKAKEIDEALAISETMKKNGCVPDAAFCSSLIYILCKAGRLKDAQDVFEDMPNQGLIPDVLTYNTMITSACHHLQEENALKLLQKMEENHCPPDLETYIPLLKMCCRLKRIKMIYFLLSHMLRNDVSVGLDTYVVLIRGLCRSGKLEHACLFFEEAVLRKFVPWENIYKDLEKKLEERGMSKAKKQIEELMLLAKQQKT
ncbi:hypothetical protein DCAR_0935640 [Daucus carota subsp. sativus]|uniref:Uncharacterized protein n=1 Tax=Daucus carota subsp. sativus TaxID=79200 RepID=A0A175YI70_DAUCS|nr:PREDICTED: pentatricopeptide repeat-containing protein At3g22670, mitochondrial-like [Daucus carota subsp. sativus]XP_017225674.1 PREDICTED: pentatricopeptide repeat-containing protein At3g22670, mitochondrial-like [Daucus carota subsp. sativus]WOH16091.1 hypothetical protein DCAR_0935640 [Daucus carota subsp. sativus]